VDKTRESGRVASGSRTHRGISLIVRDGRINLTKIHDLNRAIYEILYERRAASQAKRMEMFLGCQSADASMEATRHGHTKTDTLICRALYPRAVRYSSSSVAELESSFGYGHANCELSLSVSAFSIFQGT